MTTWISRKCTDEILAAIKSKDDLTYIFNIVGAGGTGKTIILRQIGEQLGSINGTDANYPWGGILDLFHSEVNTNSGLEDLLSRSFERNEEFMQYHAERKKFLARRQSGETGKELEKERTQLSATFADCMNKVTSKDKVVIALDTAEKVQYETDEIQELCQLEGESSSVKEWLLHQLSQWKNCIVLLAGRENKDLNDRLQDEISQLSHIKYKVINLRGFDEDEAAEYFKTQETDHQIIKEFDVKFRKQLWEITNGKPIRLDLAIYITEHELGLEEFSQIIGNLPPEESQDALDQKLIDHLMQHENDTSTRTIFNYLAITRKGLDARLLQYLAEGEWSLQDCQSKLDQISERSFIKKRPNDGRFFLHDEVYDLCDKYMLDTPDVQEKCIKLVSWYDAQSSSSADQVGLSEGEKEKQSNQIDSIIYRLRANPISGYQWYSVLSDEAIRYAEIGLDMRLRNELFSFLKGQSAIDQELIKQHQDLQKEITYNTAADWVKRYVSRGAYDKAIGVGRKMYIFGDKFFKSESLYSKLARADFDVYFSQALIYSGEIDEAIKILDNVILELEKKQLPEKLAHTGNPHDYSNRRLNLILGRAHNNLGYAIWTGKGRLHKALNKLRPAIPYFRASDLHEEYANTMDNMGRIYALLYERDRAEAMLDDGLSIRKRLRREYRIALSLNSRAIGFLAFGDPHSARKFANEALKMFMALNVQRGIGLSALTLGRALRKLGNTWGTSFHSLDECIKFSEEAEGMNRKSIEIFEISVREPLRLLNAYNELGCTLRDRAIMQSNTDSISISSSSLASDAIKVFLKAIEMAKDDHPRIYINCCEDLAQTLYQQNELDKAENWLVKAKDFVPIEYFLKNGQGLPDLLESDELVEEYFLLLGKVELLSGYITYQKGFIKGQGRVGRESLATPMQHFVFSITYFELYSKRAAGRETAYKQLYDRFKKCSTEDLKYLRDVTIPTIASDYGLDPTWVGALFEDTLGLAIQLEI